MLARSLVVLLGGALTVAAVPGKQHLYPYEGYDNQMPDQWVARLDKPFLGKPRLPDLPMSPGPLPHGPHHAPPHHPKVDDKTIFQALEDDDRFSRVFKLVNYTEEVASLLNDSSKSVTFFAPPDRALKPPKRHGKHKHHKDTDFDEIGVEAFFSSDVSETSDELELFAALEGFVDDQLLETQDDHNGDDDDDKERKRNIIKKIVTAVLKYHILPAESPAHELAKNYTHPTVLSLGDGSFHGEPLRLRVEQPPRLFKPTLSLNFYAKVVFADVKTKNGLIHVVNHPLFPPPSIFTTLFAFSDVFSTLTSVIQRVNFTDAIDWHWVKESKTLEGNPSVTFFAPTNRAFHRLPKRLKFYLFSPFGQRALKKILAFHTVPDFILHSNWAHNASDEDVAIHANAMQFDGDEYEHIPSAYDSEDFDFDFNGRRDDSMQKSFERRPDGSQEGYIIGRGCVRGPGEDQLQDPLMRQMHLELQRCGPETRQGKLSVKTCAIELPPHLVGECGGPHLPRRFEGFPFGRDPLEHAQPLPAWGPHHPPPPPDHPHPPPPPHHAPFPHPKPVYAANITLPTLLANHTLFVHVAQYHTILPHRKYATAVFVNGQLSIASDVPARNGAVHVIDRLISPRHKHGPPGAPGHDEFDGEHGDFWVERAEQDDKDWEEWEEWLPEWAAED